MRQQPRKHLGEAETIAVVRNRFQGSRFITDDHGAHLVAKGFDIACYGTADLLRAAEAHKLITPGQHAADLATLRLHGRVARAYFD